MIKKLFFFSGIICLLFSCISLNKAGRIYPIQMASTLSYGGFTIDRPIYNEWYLLPQNQSWTQANFYRETESKCHSVYFYVAIDTIKESSFEKYAENIMVKRGVITDSIRFIVKKSVLTKIDSVSYKFETEVIDKKPLNKSCGALIIREEGYILKHKYLENRILYLNFSERGTQNDFDLNFFEERKQLIKSVKPREKI